ncbi:MAG: zinc-binding dehydrogenase [Acidimicrobiia bacterium]|nr:zinc-binding dehydrogenase [Acidimicrobiia bacterium]
MRALQLVNPGKPLELREVAAPELGPVDVAVAVKAAGICRSDVHYRAGFPQVGPLPLTLGHEVAGVVAEVGAEVAGLSTGDRVCVHYQVGCGSCAHCTSDLGMFCADGKMIGNGRDGGYADRIVIPARNVIPVPDSVPLDQAAVMMCSSATSLHALRKGRLSPGESVAVFGAGGLGMSAIQLALIEGADRVFAVDINPTKLAAAAALGAIPIDANGDAVAALQANGGCDVTLDLVGSAGVMRHCLDSLAPLGRAVAVGLTPDTFPVGPYTDLVSGESELIGTSDHTAGEIVELLDLAAEGRFDVSRVVQQVIPLDVDAVNAAMDDLESFGDTLRTVIKPD